MSKTAVHPASLAALKNDKNDIWGGKSFGFVQMLHYVASAAGLMYYAWHSLTGQPLAQRVQVHGTLELVLLATRWLNEIYFGKWGIGDVFHHLCMVVAYYLVFFVPSCAEFGWALCQMQILHIPMLLWYVGCRRGCYSTNKSVTGFCVWAFSPVWIMSTSYRASIVLTVAYKSVFGGNTVASFAVVAFGIVLAYLDMDWTNYFFCTLNVWGQGEDGKDREKTAKRGLSLGLNHGLFLSAFSAALMTLFLVKSIGTP